VDKLNILKDTPDYEDYTTNIMKEIRTCSAMCCGKCNRCNNKKCKKETCK